MYIFDVLTFCIAFYNFQGDPGHEHADVILLVMTLIFLVVDGYYFTWVLSLKAKVPPEMACYISDAILGYTKKMAFELNYNLDEKSRGKVKEAKSKYAHEKN